MVNVNIVFSGSLVFLLYILVGRKERNIGCQSCNYIQSDKLLYCGRCGSEIKIDRYEEDLNQNTKKILLKLGIILLVISIVGGIKVSFRTLSGEWDSIPVSIMSVSNKYNNKWTAKFKFKNGKGSHSFKVKEKTTLNASWDVDDGYIEAKLYKDNKIIKEINSKDHQNYKESIDLSNYEGSKVILKLKFEKASGQIKFILE